MIQRLFKIFALIIVAYSAMVLIGGKSKSIGRFLLNSDVPATISGGDLYALSLIETFRDSIPLVVTPRNSSVEGSPILLMGDSFMACNLESDVLANLLADSLGVNTFEVPGEPASNFRMNPLPYLASIGYEKGERKTLILENVERYVVDFALGYREPYAAERFRSLKELRRNVFFNDDLDYFYRQNRFFFPIYKGILNLRFHLLSDMNAQIGRWSLDPKMLFYAEAVDFNLREKDAATLDAMTENIAWLSKRLDEDYNIDLVYLVMPNKYSIYGRDIDPDYQYDQFIPKLQSRMQAKGISFIDAYGLYRRYRDSDDQQLLYYPSDTHFTPFGKEMVLQEILTVLNQN